MLGKALCLAALALSPVNALWPVPKKTSLGDSPMFMAQTVKITYNGDTVRWPPTPTSLASQKDRGNYRLHGPLAKNRFTEQISETYGYEPPSGTDFTSKDIVQGGVSRAFQNIFNDNFAPWKLRERGSDFEPDLSKATWIKSLELVQTGKDKTFAGKAGDIDESYSLKVGKNGKARITAETSFGLLWGLETFSQLFFQTSDGTHTYTTSVPVDIEDEPEYPHRGILMDVARNWFEKDDIKRTIGALAMNKMNRLHLHVTDSQSWPLEIPALPKLAEKGAYAKGLSYSPADIQELYEYATHRGVQMIMEIDMPGHIGVVSLAYDDLVVAYNEKPYQWYCAEPPCGALRLNNSKVDDFIDTLFDDLLPRVAPYSAYFHTGGDELNANDSMLDPGVKSNDTDVLEPLLQDFLDNAHGKITKAGLTPLVWEEMISTWNQTVPKGTIVQSWLGGTAAKDLAEAGHLVINSDYNFWYLDCGRGQWVVWQNGEAFQSGYPFNDWCGPTKSWELVYSFDPAQGVTGDARKNILGGEVGGWSEKIDAQNLDLILWPRASAAGEVLWSGREDAQGKNRSQYDAVPRLNEWRERMVARGIRAEPVQMIFCSQGTVEDCGQVVV